MGLDNVACRADSGGMATNVHKESTMSYPIYFTKGTGARDDFVTDSDGWCALDALERFAASSAVGGYSVDTDSAGRLFLCLDRCRGFFYTYLGA